MDDHEIVVFGGENSERAFHTHAQITNTNSISEFDRLLQRKTVKACVIDCDDSYDGAFASISRLRPELTVALCEKFDFQRLVVATETGRMQHIRIIASLWRQSTLGVLADMDELVKAEAGIADDLEPVRECPTPLRASRKQPQLLAQASI